MSSDLSFSVTDYTDVHSTYTRITTFTIISTDCIGGPAQRWFPSER